MARMRRFTWKVNQDWQRDTFSVLRISATGGSNWMLNGVTREKADAYVAAKQLDQEQHNAKVMEAKTRAAGCRYLIGSTTCGCRDGVRPVQTTFEGVTLSDGRVIGAGTFTIPMCERHAALYGGAK